MLLWLLAAATLAAHYGAVAQAPFMSGQWISGYDLPGQPIAIADARDVDGQYCAFRCNALSTCGGFNYAPYGCASTPPCTLSAGCCFLKNTSITSGNIITSGPTCASSFMMKPPAAAGVPHAAAAPPAGAKNVLYLLVDDLRPDVAPYGADWMTTPGIQAIANTGVTFDRAYCTISVCSPSRMSFLTGKYPHHTRVWNFVNHFRQVGHSQASFRTR